MNPKFSALGFYPADILLPKEADMTKWAVVACDQFTSQPEYWQAVEQTVGEAPSTLRLMLPESKLGDPDVDREIAGINTAMKAYLDQACSGRCRNPWFTSSACSPTAKCAGASSAWWTWTSTISRPAPAP
jgi:hypothetical protein